MTIVAQQNFTQSLKVQWRVVYAVIMREIITRYGRHNIGFAWMFVEPMLFTLGVTLLWSISKEGSHGHHVTVASFAVTSYSTVLVWRNTINRCTDAIEPNRPLLYHRNVSVFDVFIGRILLELIGVTLAVTVIFLAFLWLDIIKLPYNVLGMLGGWALLCWYTIAMALIIGSLSDYSELVDRIWHPLSYFQLPVSGAFAFTAQLPPAFQKIVLLFPATNCTEVFRSSYYGPAVKSMYDIPYVVVVNMVLTWLGLYLVRKVSRRPSR